MIKLLIIHGPNLGLLGHREKDIYGDISLSQINQRLKDYARRKKVQLKIFQSNYEGEIVDALGKAQGRYDGIVINPAAYTHTSIAIRDAISAVSLPTVEVHLSNIYNRERFRHKSLIAPVVRGQICGFGYYSYILGVEAIISILKGK